MSKLEGRTVALLETRKASDLAAVVQRFGGSPRCVASVREVRRTEDITPALGRLASGAFDGIVILTATACEALLAEAERAGMLDAATSALRQMTIVARGPKPLLSLRQRGLTAQIVTERPHTTQELLDALAATELDGRRLLLLHYGEKSDGVSDALRARGAQVEDLFLYEWALPETLAPLEALVDDAVAGHVDAVLFTSQIQFRHLLHVARISGRDIALTNALRERIVVGSVGPVCTRALRAEGVVPDVMPRFPNGPSLVQALADYYDVFNPPEELTS